MREKEWQEGLSDVGNMIINIHKTDSFITFTVTEATIMALGCLFPPCLTVTSLSKTVKAAAAPAQLIEHNTHSVTAH